MSRKSSTEKLLNEYYSHSIQSVIFAIVNRLQVVGENHFINFEP